MMAAKPPSLAMMVTLSADVANRSSVGVTDATNPLWFFIAVTRACTAPCCTIVSMLDGVWAMRASARAELLMVLGFFNDSAEMRAGMPLLATILSALSSYR